MGTSGVRAVIQARMTSSRFPGKVLAPLAGKPLILHVLGPVVEVVGLKHVVVATTADAADDALVAYLDTLGTPYFRGPRDDVLERFKQCAVRFPCEWILRICADSPFLDPQVLRQVIAAAENDCDLATTIYPRKAGSGRNAELIRTETLLTLDPAELTPSDREHVTRFFYSHPHRFNIHPVEIDDPGAGRENLTIDTVEDLRRLERLL
jgi:spore coat polysaccharide biosynthesis protein SpsF